MKYINSFQVFESSEDKLVPIPIEMCQDIEDIIVDYQDEDIEIDKEFYDEGEHLGMGGAWHEIDKFDSSYESISIRVWIKQMPYNSDPESVDRVYELCNSIINYCNSSELKYNLHVKIINDEKYISGRRTSLNDKIKKLKYFLSISKFVDVCINTGKLAKE